MKKALCIFAVLLVNLLLLSSCKTKEYTPEIPASFIQKATVTSGDFNYECEICKKEESVFVNVLSSDAQGMVMSYSGEKINFSFSNFDFDISPSALKSSNCAVIMFDVLSMLPSESATIRRTDNGFRYEGKTSAGSFVLIQNDDSSFESLSFKDNDFSVQFK